MMELLPPPPNAPPYDPPLTTREKCIAEMSQAGFRDVDVHEVTFAAPPTTPTEAWALMQRTTAPVLLRRQHLGEERWAEISKEVLVRLRAKLGDEPRSIEMAAYLTIGRA